MEVFKVNKVTKSYGDRLILDGVSFAIESGQRVAIMGPSGVGKTSLIGILSARDFPDSGEVSLLGKSINELTSRRELSAKVGVIHQQYDLVPNLSVIQNVLAGNLGRWSFVTSVMSLFVPRERDKALEAIGKVRNISGYNNIIQQLIAWRYERDFTLEEAVERKRQNSP